MFADKVFFIFAYIVCSTNAVYLKYPYGGYGGNGGYGAYGGNGVYGPGVYGAYGAYGKPATSYVEIEKAEGAPIYEVPKVPIYNQYGIYPKTGYGQDYYAYPKYQFNYGVHDPHTGDYKNQQEVRDGDVVKGSYQVADPDGTLRTVHYTADDLNGFNAVVTKAGHAVHPVPVAYEKPYLAVPKAYVAEPIYEHY